MIQILRVVFVGVVGHRLLYGPKNGLALIIGHVDTHSIPKGHEWRARSPYSSVSSIRRSAMQQEPWLRSRFDTVPEPMILPALKARLFAACWINSAKLNVMSVPAWG